MAAASSAMAFPARGAAADDSTTDSSATTVAPDLSGTTSTVPSDDSSTSSTTTAPSTTTTTVPPNPAQAPAPGAEPHIDPAPIVRVNTMVKQGDQWGVQVQVSSDIAPTDWNCPPQDLTQYSTNTDSGYSCFYADPKNGTYWVQLLVLSRTDLHMVHNDDLICQTATNFPQEAQFDIQHGGPNPWTGNTNPCINALVQYIDTQTDNGDLVIAVSQPGTDPKAQPPVGLGAALSGKFIYPDPKHNLGIKASNWFDAKNNGAQLPPAVRGTFSAIGVPTYTTGGIAKLASSPDQAGQGALTAYVALNNNNRYTPLVAPDTDEMADAPLVKVLTQDPTQPWPGSSDSHKMAAFSYLGRQVGLGSHPRSQFYTQSPTDLDDAAKKIDGVTYVANPDYSSRDLDWAKGELKAEISDVDAASHALATWARPYETEGNDAIWQFSAMVNQVNATTSNGTTATVLSVASEVLTAALELVPVIGQAAKIGEAALKVLKNVVTATRATYNVALTVAGAANEPAESDFTAASTDLAGELEARFQDASAEISKEWLHIIVADYGKLDTVATCSQSLPGCSDPGTWKLSSYQQTQMTQVLSLGFQRTLYTELVPVKYPLAMILWTLQTSPNAPSAGAWCASGPPFTGTTGIYMKPTPGGYYAPIVLTTGNTTKNWEAASWSMFNRMFDPPSPDGNIRTGGLGIPESSFIDDAYAVKFEDFAPNDPDLVRPITSAHFAPSFNFVSLLLCRW